MPNAKHLRAASNYAEKSAQTMLGCAISIVAQLALPFRRWPKASDSSSSRRKPAVRP